MRLCLGEMAALGHNVFYRHENITWANVWGFDPQDLAFLQKTEFPCGKGNLGRGGEVNLRAFIP